MRLLAVVLLAGCATVPSPEGLPLPAAPTSPETELRVAWEREVDDAVAGLTAVRPRLTSVESQVLALYDAQLKGLQALAGAPTVPAVEAKVALLGKGANPKAIADLSAAKAALDSRTTALEASARTAELARVAAEARASAAAEEARLAEAASNLSRVAALAIAAGVLALLFGHFLRIPRWVAALTIGLGLLVATLAPQLLTLFGSDKARHIMLATLGALALSGTVSVILWTWSKLRPSTPEPCPHEQAPPTPQERPPGD